MAIVFDPAEGAAQAWGVNETISPVLLPAPTGAVGAVSYRWEGLPPGVEFNEDTLVIFGAPTEAGSGRFVLEATDDDGVVEWPLDWTVVPFTAQLEVAAFDDLRVTVGQPVDYQLPTPVGGIPPYSYSIVDPVYSFEELGRGWPYDPRLPQGISFSDGQFTGTATDTQDNRGEIWYDRVSDVNRTAEGNPVTRLRPIWEVPTRIENRFFDYETSRYDISLLISRTRPTPGVAYGPDAPSGGLRLRTSSPSGHGRLDNRNVGTVPHCNPFVRITSVSNPGRQATFYFAGMTTSPSGAWAAFWSPDYPVVAPWLDTEANTGTDFRVEIGTSRTYPITIRVADSVGTAIDQTITVRVDSAPPGAPPAPTVLTADVLAHSLNMTLQTAPVGSSMEYFFSTRSQPITGWTPFTGTQLYFRGLTSGIDYSLWVRLRNDAGAGPAVLYAFTTLDAAGVVQAPAPTSLTWDNNPGDQQGILDGALRVRWDVADITTQVFGYDYQVVEADQTLSVADADWRPIPASTSSTSVFTIRGLRNGTMYKVGIRARNEYGPGRPAEIVGAPEAGMTDTGYARWQLQIMMDLSREDSDPRDVLWFDLASRCLAMYIHTGREARRQLTVTGTCAFLLETSDDFINVEGSSLYRLDSLQNRQVRINEVLETPGGVRRRTRFQGLVETAKFKPSGNRSVIEVVAVDILGLMAQDEATFTTDLPEQSTGERIRLLLDRAGWEADGDRLRSYDTSLISEGTRTCARIPVEEGSPFRVNLLEELNLTAQSEGGRLYIAGGGDNRGGSVRFDGTSPITVFDGHITSERNSNPAVISPGSEPQIESEDSFLYNHFALEYEGGGDEILTIAADTRSVDTWGKRSYDLYTKVRTNRESTLSLLRTLRKQYTTPRQWISSLPVAGHFQTGAAAAVLQELDLSKSLLINYTPPGARNTISDIQRVDHITITYTPLDRQFVAVDMELGLLIPESSAYWILGVEGSDRFDAGETYLAPRRNLDPPVGAPGGRLPGGFRVTADREYQVMSANRYDALLAQQVLPRYTSEVERDRYEGDPGTAIGPVDGRACVVIRINESGEREMRIYEYEGASHQWLRRAQVSHADANPTTQTFILGDATRGVLGLAAGNVLDAGTLAANLRA